jgi:hypothetical protein
VIRDSAGGGVAGDSDRFILRAFKLIREQVENVCARRGADQHRDRKILK